MNEWKIICLTTSEEERIKRLKKLYPNNFKDHIKNMKHISENGKLDLPEDTLFIDTKQNIEKLKSKLKISLKL